MTATGGFELNGHFLGPGDQTLTWTWKAYDTTPTVVAENSGTWTVGDDPLFMDPDDSGTYTGWKKLWFKFNWTLGEGDVVSLSATRLVAVPDPSFLLLPTMGVLALLAYAWRRRRAA